MLATYKIEDKRICESPRETATIWSFINPDENEKKSLINDFKLDEHTLLSVLDPDELARLEFEPDHTAVIFKQPKNYSGKEQLSFKVASMGLFLFNDKLVIILPEDIPLFSGKIFNTVDSLKDLFLKIIYRSIFHFLEHLKIINMITEEIEHKISVSMENKYLLNLFSLEKSLVYYLNAINSNNFVFAKLRNNAVKIEFSQKETEFLDDMIIENGQCFGQAEIYSNILASLMDARVSIVSNNLNILMKTLNLITIIIMVPTLVVSFFSMNVNIPLQGHPQAFWIISFFVLLSVTLVIAWWNLFLRKLYRQKD
ncbi:MAG TPA: magnesium transporter CorA family protein [Candidatus Omnitrophota bacterium]|nr:magnesium transporter CorA family protein [Candidatus Omnitrophota bacterium]